MTSRDRVLMALAHEEPDRVPMDFSANVATLERLMRDLQVATHRDLLDRLHVDMVDLRGVVNPVYRGPGLEVTHRSDGITENYWGCAYGQWRPRPVRRSVTASLHLPRQVLWPTWSATPGPSRIGSISPDSPSVWNRGRTLRSWPPGPACSSILRSCGGWKIFWPTWPVPPNSTRIFPIVLPNSITLTSSGCSGRPGANRYLADR